MKTHFFTSLFNTILVVVFFHFNLYAQDTNHESFNRHGIQVELAGSSLFYSVGYQYFLNPNLSIGAGFGYFRFDTGEDVEFNTKSFLRGANVPIVITYFKGKSNHKLELYGGIRFEKIESNISGIKPREWNTVYLAPNAGLGYRYLGKRWFGGISLRLTRLALLEKEASSTFLLLPILGLRTGIRL